MTTLFLILISAIFVSLISFVGVFTLLFKQKLFDRILFDLIALSAGGLIGGAFLHLIPEAIERFGQDGQDVFFYTILGFFLFFLLEKILYWRHCHNDKCQIHTFAYLNLLGDSIHNFIDGLVIAASFITSAPLGIVTTLAIALHEVPQELGDFGVLVYAGFKKTRAFAFNFLTAVLAVAGGIFGYLLSIYSESIATFLLPFAAGGFIYIAASDLIPEIKREPNLKKSLFNLLIFSAGILIIYSMRFLGVH